jgi:hypothetical protein
MSLIAEQLVIAFHREDSKSFIRVDTIEPDYRRPPRSRMSEPLSKDRPLERGELRPIEATLARPIQSHPISHGAEVRRRETAILREIASSARRNSICDTRRGAPEDNESTTGIQRAKAKIELVARGVVKSGPRSPLAVPVRIARLTASIREGHIT